MGVAQGESRGDDVGDGGTTCADLPWASLLIQVFAIENQFFTMI